MGAADEMGSHTGANDTRIDSRIDSRIDPMADHHPVIDADFDVIDVFATGTTVLRVEDRSTRPAVEGPPDHHVRELVRQGGQTVRVGLAHLGDYQARPGPRPGVRPLATSARRGGRTDIVRPMLVHPALAVRLVCDGGLFERPVPHLRLPERDDSAERHLVWPVTIVDLRPRNVPAHLHLLASPSMVVSVLELIPSRRLRFGRGPYLAAAVPAVDELARRIERAAA